MKYIAQNSKAHHKSGRLLIATFSLLSIIAACDRDAKEAAKPQGQELVTPAQVASEPHFQHGFGGDSAAFQLVDQLGIEHSKTDLFERHGITEQEFDAWRKDPPSLIYSGRLLGLSECGDAELTRGAQHITELWTQDYLLGLYAHPSINWLYQAIKSLEEKDPTGRLRPVDPVHPNLVTRLNRGMDPANWTLNAIRFRIADRATRIGAVQEEIDEATGQSLITTAEVPDELVSGQIKLNYELDLVEATAHEEIQSVSFIHSIAINPLYINEFIVDVLRIRQDPATSGCDILKLLNKWVRNQGMRESDVMRSSYFFLHTNILDQHEKVKEWRFAELKPVDNDYIDFSQRDSLDAATRDSILEGWVQALVAKHDFSKGDPDLSSIDYAAIGEALERISVSATRRINGPFETTVNKHDPELALRITPMSFPRFVAPSPFSDRIELATNLPPVDIWFSGTLIDEGRNQREGMRRINLLVDRDGREVSMQHPGRRHEQTWTCAQCHMRQVSNHLQSAPSQWGALLDVITFQNFRHIGYGDGGNKSCNGMMGFTRAWFQPSLSEFLLDVAGGAKIHGVAVDHKIEAKLGIEEAPTTQAGRFEFFRCQANRFDFIDAGMTSPFSP